MTNSPKEPLISITEKDFLFKCSRGSGKGGQKRNKTSSKVLCIHKPSGSYAYSDISRSQAQNKKDAFTKCVSTKEFQVWLKLEISKKAGELARIEDEIDKSLENSEQTIVETKDDNGRWVRDD